MIVEFGTCLLVRLNGLSAEIFVVCVTGLVKSTPVHLSTMLMPYALLEGDGMYLVHKNEKYIGSKVLLSRQHFLYIYLFIHFFSLGKFGYTKFASEIYLAFVNLFKLYRMFKRECKRNKYFRIRSNVTTILQQKSQNFAIFFIPFLFNCFVFRKYFEN